MKKNWMVASTGFAFFSMFFGSGNLVYPLIAGKASEGHVAEAAIGFLLTGVLVPFLGVLGMMLFQGDLQQFFRPFGKKGTWLFSLFALSLMGPFGVLARCLTVAHGALSLLIDPLSLPLTSLALCAIVYVLTVNKSKIVSRLGVLLTPFLLGSIALIAVFGLNQAESMPAQNIEKLASFKTGFFQGYQTMDLLAAFFFSTFIIQHLYQTLSTECGGKTALSIFCRAAFLGAGLLALVYVALVMLGWNYASVLSENLPQKMLGTIAIASLGNFAAPIVCIAVVLACLTTAIVLTSLFADFLKREVLANKIELPSSIVLTLLIGFSVSTLDFNGIAQFLGPILDVIYPALIVLTVVNIACKLCEVRASHWPFTLTIAAKLCLI